MAIVRIIYQITFLACLLASLCWFFFFESHRTMGTPFEQICEFDWEDWQRGFHIAVDNIPGFVHWAILALVILRRYRSLKHKHDGEIEPPEIGHTSSPDLDFEPSMPGSFENDKDEGSVGSAAEDPKAPSLSSFPLVPSAPVTSAVVVSTQIYRPRKTPTDKLRPWTKPWVPVSLVSEQSDPKPVELHNDVPRHRREVAPFEKVDRHVATERFQGLQTRQCSKIPPHVKGTSTRLSEEQLPRLDKAWRKDSLQAGTREPTNKYSAQDLATFGAGGLDQARPSFPRKPGPRSATTDNGDGVDNHNHANVTGYHDPQTPDVVLEKLKIKIPATSHKPSEHSDKPRNDSVVDIDPVAPGEVPSHATEAVSVPVDHIKPLVASTGSPTRSGAVESRDAVAVTPAVENPMAFPQHGRSRSLKLLATEMNEQSVPDLLSSVVDGTPHRSAKRKRASSEPVLPYNAKRFVQANRHHSRLESFQRRGLLTPKRRLSTPTKSSVRYWQKLVEDGFRIAHVFGTKAYGKKWPKVAVKLQSTVFDEIIRDGRGGDSTDTVPAATDVRKSKSDDKLLEKFFRGDRGAGYRDHALTTTDIWDYDSDDGDDDSDITYDSDDSMCHRGRQLLVITEYSAKTASSSPDEMEANCVNCEALSLGLDESRCGDVQMGGCEMTMVDSLDVGLMRWYKHLATNINSDDVYEKHSGTGFSGILDTCMLDVDMEISGHRSGYQAEETSIPDDLGTEMAIDPFDSQSSFSSTWPPQPTMQAAPVQTDFGRPFPQHTQAQSSVAGHTSAYPLAGRATQVYKHSPLSQQLSVPRSNGSNSSHTSMSSSSMTMQRPAQQPAPAMMPIAQDLASTYKAPGYTRQPVAAPPGVNRPTAPGSFAMTPASFLQASPPQDQQQAPTAVMVAPTQQKQPVAPPPGANHPTGSISLNMVPATVAIASYGQQRTGTANVTQQRRQPVPPLAGVSRVAAPPTLNMTFAQELQSAQASQRSQQIRQPVPPPAGVDRVVAPTSLSMTFQQMSEPAQAPHKTTTAVAVTQPCPLQYYGSPNTTRDTQPDDKHQPLMTSPGPEWSGSLMFTWIKDSGTDLIRHKTCSKRDCHCLDNIYERFKQLEMHINPYAVTDSPVPSWNNGKARELMCQELFKKTKKGQGFARLRTELLDIRFDLDGERLLLQFRRIMDTLINEMPDGTVTGQVRDHWVDSTK